MADKRVLLLTGFEAFGKHVTNPELGSVETCTRPRRFTAAGVAVEIACLPVDYARAFEAFMAALDRYKPAACASFGVHGTDDDVIRLERTARNRDGANAADNAGIRRGEQPIVDGGETELPSTLPLADIKAALAGAGFDARYSDNAGQYLCNHVFYRGASALRGRMPYGFIHVPPVGGSGMTLERLADAMVLAATSIRP